MYPLTMTLAMGSFERHGRRKSNKLVDHITANVHKGSIMNECHLQLHELKGNIRRRIHSQQGWRLGEVIVVLVSDIFQKNEEHS